MRVEVGDDLLDLRVGHVIDVLRELPEGSVHCCVTSPPYFALRSYDAADQVWGGDPEHEHEWGEPLVRRGMSGTWEHSTLGEASGGNALSLEARERLHNAQVSTDSVSHFCGCGAWKGQLGLEPTPDLFIEHLVLVFREVRRVLRPDGSLWVNLGDSYASAGGRDLTTREDRPYSATMHAQGGASAEARKRDESRRPPPGLKPKDLIGVPWMLAFALRADGWWLRSENIWRKMGGMPESVFDRTARNHEHIFHLVPSARYFYDTDAVREPYAPDNRVKTTVKAGPNSIQHRDGERWPHPDGKIRRTVWDMPTANYPGAHFAVFPDDLPELCVKATTSERGCCPVCGAPWERLVEADGETTEQRRARQPVAWQDAEGIAPRSDGGTMQQGVRVGLNGDRRTVGWVPTCKHVDLAITDIAGDHPPFEPVPCTVLDPFAGSGTTMVVARRLGRASVGIELSETYASEETTKRLASWWKDPFRPRAVDESQESLF